MDKPYGVPADFAEHFKLMSNMIAIAFQADQTRIVTFLMTREGSSRAYRELGIPDGHHPLHAPSQSAGPDGEGAQDQRVSRAAVRRLHRENEGHERRRPQPARQQHDRLRRRPFGSATRICMRICRPSSWARGGNYFKTGRRVLARRETPMCNLFLTMMDRMGVHAEHFGDSTGRLQRAGSGVNLGELAMQFGRGKPSAGAFFDSRFHDHRQPAGGQALLHGLQGKNDCRVAIVTMSRPNLAVAGFIDMVERFYRGPAGNFAQVPPIGMRTVGISRAKRRPPSRRRFRRRRRTARRCIDNHVKTRDRYRRSRTRCCGIIWKRSTTRTHSSF